MRHENNVSFHRDLSKHYEFKEKLTAILNSVDSSIANCGIRRNDRREFILFFIPKKATSSNDVVTFNFCSFFSGSSEKDDEFYSYYLKYGLSRTDIDNLSDFLDNYAFTNFFEGSFFASRFFEKELKPLEKHCIYFKFTPDETKSMFFIDDKKLEKKTSSISLASFKHLVNNSTNLDFTQPLLKFNTYGFEHHRNMANCIQSIEKANKTVPSPQIIAVEEYVDLETYATYIKSIFNVIDGQLVEIDIQTLINKVD